MYNGIIVVNKDAGMSSHDVVYRLRKMTGQKKIGHMGTLDPQARGVLPVCMGSATRLSDLFLKADKQYRAIMRLGIITDTQDMTGTIQSRCSGELPKQESIVETVRQFQGRISQIPPMYSAVKHQGKKLYQLARKGVEIERTPRIVTIHEIVVERMEADRVTLLVTCSKGTYIRTLCADIGEKLGCGACMEDLVRTKSGPFDIKDARSLTEIEETLQNGLPVDANMIPVDAFFFMLPGFCSVPEDDYLLWNGNPLLMRDMERMTVPDEGPGSEKGSSVLCSDEVVLPDGLSADNAIRMYDSKGSFWGVYIKVSRKGLYKPWKMFPPDVPPG